MYQPTVHAATNTNNQNHRHPEERGFDAFAWDSARKIGCFAGGMCSSM
jgi:hypothetical protein